MRSRVVVDCIHLLLVGDEGPVELLSHFYCRLKQCYVQEALENVHAIVLQIYEVDYENGCGRLGCQACQLGERQKVGVYCAGCVGTHCGAQRTVEGTTGYDTCTGACVGIGHVQLVGKESTGTETGTETGNCKV